MVRREVAFTPQALDDMARINEWGREAPKASRLLLLAVRRCLLQLQALPYSAPVWLHGARRATVLTHSVATHSVAYRVLPGAVLVLGVVDSRAQVQLLRRVR